jgi:hypothetical protein
MYYAEYQIFTDEEGWYVYFKPEDPRCRSIRKAGPLVKEKAEEMVEVLTLANQ